MPDGPGKPDDLQALAHASEGLTYPSESDAPFEPFRWPGARPGESAPEAVVAHGKRGAKIEEVSPADFFAELDSTDEAERYRQLRRVLESRLSDLKVIRAGERK